MDSEHELLCEYYKKYQEQSKKFQNDKIKTTLNNDCCSNQQLSHCSQLSKTLR